MTRASREQQEAKIYPLALKKPPRRTAGLGVWAESRGPFSSGRDRTHGPSPSVGFVAGAAAAALLLAAVAVLTVGFRASVKAELRESRKQVRTLTGTLREAENEVAALRQTLRLAIRDTNEARWAVGLPPGEYATLDMTLDMTDDSSNRSASGDLPFFIALDLMEDSMAEERFLDGFEHVRKILGNAAANLSLSVEESNPLELVLLRDADQYFRVGAERGSGAGTGTIVIESFLGAVKRVQLNALTTGAPEARSEMGAGDLRAEIELFLEQNIDTLESHYASVSDMGSRLGSARNDGVLLRTLGRKRLGIAGPAGNGERLRYSVTRGAERYLEFGVDKRRLRYFISAPDAETHFSSYDAFLDALRASVDDLDTRGDVERRIDAARRRVGSILADAEFHAVLGRKVMFWDGSVRDTERFILYDIRAEHGERIGSFGIRRATGELVVLDGRGNPLCALESLVSSSRGPGQGRPARKMPLPPTIPRIRDIYASESLSTYLLCGTSEGLTDTLMLAAADHGRETLTLISIPRDLFYKNSKINYVGLRYGMDQLLEELSQITGLRISSFVTIDMFAFIEAVDILGGIDVTLESDLVDPTYRTEDNGRQSYLSYGRGSHHLTGVEALRIARSRSYTSDFDRAERQQIIVEALKSKLDVLSLVSMKKIHALLRSLLEYVDTNLSVFDIARALLKLRSYRVDAHHVLDDSNVLRSTNYRAWVREQAAGEGVDTSAREPQIGDDPSDPGPYILVPRNGDWNLIRWYIRKLLVS